MIEADAFVTAGGRSSRMGTDKAWLELGGQSMIERVVAALKPVASRVAIIANSDAYDRLGLTVFPDVQKEIGPLEAIRTALVNSNAEQTILVGCDLPFVTSELFSFLLSVSEKHQAIVPTGANGTLESLCAIYCKNALKAVLDLISVGERKVSYLFDRVETRFVSFNELQHLNGSELFFQNINTPADYERALEAVNRSKLLGITGQPST